jgi:hypothetical protein
MTDHADLLISGGSIVDGTGAPGRPATIAVVEGRIRELGAGEYGVGTFIHDLAHFTDEGVHHSSCTPLLRPKKQ